MQADSNIEMKLSWEETFGSSNSCKLEEISLGWGFSSLAVEALRPAVAALRALTVGLGGSLGEDALRLLPTICPLLERLTLYFQVVLTNF